MQKPITKQSGVALIIFAMIIALATIAFLVTQLDGKSIKIAHDKKTSAALVEAKNALIGWSVSQAKPGLLPCPEDTALIGTANEGKALVFCNPALPVIGRLPWKTLGLGDLRDGNGDKLWYSLSPGFSDTSVVINSTTTGQLNVDSTSNAAVAIVFSAGEILAGQNRPIATNILPPVVADYLDLTNNDGDINFASSGAVGSFNDEVLLVTSSDLFSLVARRILREVRGDVTQGLVSFYNTNSNYPYADIDVIVDGIADAGELGVLPVGHPSYTGTTATDASNLFFNASLKNMLVSNNWPSLINYNISPTRQTVTMTLNGQSLVLP